MCKNLPWKLFKGLLHSADPLNVEGWRQPGRQLGRRRCTDTRTQYHTDTITYKHRDRYSNRHSNVHTPTNIGMFIIIRAGIA